MIPLTHHLFKCKVLHKSCVRITGVGFPGGNSSCMCPGGILPAMLSINAFCTKSDKWKSNPRENLNQLLFTPEITFEEPPSFYAPSGRITLNRYTG